MLFLHNSNLSLHFSTKAISINLAKTIEILNSLSRGIKNNQKVRILNFRKISKQIDEFIQEEGGYWDIPWLLAAIAEEVGELSRAIQIHSKIRNNGSEEKKNTKSLIEEEIGDVLFAIICLTNYLNIELESTAQNSLNKYKRRKFPQFE